MPIYEYRCTKCGHYVEIIQKVGDRPLRKCAECSGKLEKLVSRSAFHLKGGGWYSEGYAKGGGKSGKSSEAKNSGEMKKPGEGKTDSSSKDSKDSKETKSGGTKSAAAS